MTTSLRHMLFAIALLLAPLSLGAKGAMEVSRHGMLSEPTQELFQQGVEAMRTPGGMQTAMMQFTVIASRYAQGSVPESESLQAVRAMINLSFIYGYYLFDYAQAMMWLQKAEDAALKHHLESEIPVILVNRAGVKLLSHEAGAAPIDKADLLADYRTAFNKAVELKVWDDAILALSNMVEVAFNYYMTDSVAPDTKRFRSLPVPKEVPMSAYMLHLSDAVAALNARDYPRALAALDLADKHIDTPNSPERYRMILAKDRAIVCRQSGDSRGDDLWLHRALEMSRQYDAKDAEVELLGILADRADEKGDTLVAKDLRMTYYQLKDSLLQQSRLAGVDGIEFDAKLKKVNEQVAAMAEKRRRLISLLWISLGFIAVVGLFVLLLVRKNRRLQESNRTLYLKSLEALKEEPAPAPQAKYLRSTLKEEDRDWLMEKVQEVMADASLICRDDFSLAMLADKVGAQSKHISQLINETCQCTFRFYLSQHRIREACRRLRDPQTSSTHTIEAIGESVGFKSRSAFIAAFKRVTGLSPSEYLRQARRNPQ